MSEEKSRCSFCDKPAHKVKIIVKASNWLGICNECVNECQRVMAIEVNEKTKNKESRKDHYLEEMEGILKKLGYDYSVSDPLPLSDLVVAKKDIDELADFVTKIADDPSNPLSIEAELALQKAGYETKNTGAVLMAKFENIVNQIRTLKKDIFTQHPPPTGFGRLPSSDPFVDIPFVDKIAHDLTSLDDKLNHYRDCLEEFLEAK